MRRTFPLILWAGLSFGPGCNAGESERKATSNAPYSLHCSQVGDRPECARFHAHTGAVRRIAIDRLRQGAPSAPSTGGEYALHCGNWRLSSPQAEEPAAADAQPKRPREGAEFVCLRLDRRSGALDWVRVADAQPAL